MRRKNRNTQRIEHNLNREVAMTKLSTTIIIMTVQLCAFSLQLIGWIIEYCTSHGENEMSIAGVVLVFVSTAGFFCVLLNLKWRHTAAKVRGFLEDSDLSYLR